MKFFILTSFVLAYTTCFGQQYTSIPDINFENALSEWDDDPRDGRIPTANLKQITKLLLPLSNNEVYDLTGIEDMVNLKELIPRSSLPSTSSLEALVRQHAPQIRHAKNENYHLSPVDWYLDRVRLTTAQYTRVPFCTYFRICLPGWLGGGCWENIQYQNGIDEIETIYGIGEVNDSTILDEEEGMITALTPSSKSEGKKFQQEKSKRKRNKLIPQTPTKYGNPKKAKAYVRIRSLDHFGGALAGGIEIQYNYFYPWNGDQGEDYIPCLLFKLSDKREDADHESDWEAVSVILDKDRNVLGYVSTAHGVVSYNSFSNVNKVLPSNLWDLRKDIQGHPVFYSANESHAMYTKTGYNHPSAQVDFTIDVLDITEIHVNFGFLDRCDNDGEWFNTWEGNKFEIVHIDNNVNTSTNPTNPNWLKFKGRWGIYPTGIQTPSPYGDATFWNHSNFGNLPTSSSDPISLPGVANPQNIIAARNPNDYDDDISMHYIKFDGSNEELASLSQSPRLSSSLSGSKQLPSIVRRSTAPLSEITSEVQEITLTTNYDATNCQSTIQFEDDTFAGQSVLWRVKNGVDMYVFEQETNSISIENFATNTVSTLEVSVEYETLTDSKIYTDTIQMSIPVCSLYHDVSPNDN